MPELSSVRQEYILPFQVRPLPSRCGELFDELTIVLDTLTWASNNIEGVYKRGVIIGIIVGWGNLNGIVSSNIYLKQEKPRYYTGHGTVLGYLVFCLLGGTLFMYFMLARENRLRKSGKRDRMHDGMTADEIWVAGDKRPDFIYTL